MKDADEWWEDDPFNAMHRKLVELWMELILRSCIFQGYAEWSMHAHGGDFKWIGSAVKEELSVAPASDECSSRLQFYDD